MLSWTTPTQLQRAYCDFGSHGNTTSELGEWRCKGNPNFVKMWETWSSTILAANEQYIQYFRQKSWQHIRDELLNKICPTEITADQYLDWESDKIESLWGQNTHTMAHHQGDIIYMLCVCTTVVCMWSTKFKQKHCPYLSLSYFSILGIWSSMGSVFATILAWTSPMLSSALFIVFEISSYKNHSNASCTSLKCALSNVVEKQKAKIDSSLRFTFHGTRGT